jgi:thiol-disulfide isomerase/thioredoxin
MKRVIQIWLVAIFISSLVGTSILPLVLATDNQQNQINIESTDGIATSVPYTGRLRIYVVEPVSRWNMYNGQPYHFGFLGFAINEDVAIDPGATYQNSITWNGDVTEGNAMVMAAVFNSEKNQGYANPPSGNPFWAYYTDASAAATPGNTGYNTVTTGFTHTVFVEEATATWCPYCPAMANTLNAIYESGDYPYYFVALVSDMNSQAVSRLNEYNTYGYPTAFFDGGYRVYVGGSSSESVYRTRIQACGQREVPELNLSLSVAYIGSGDLQIEVDITNGPGSNLPPATPQAPSGETNGNTGNEYTYTTTTTDPNDDGVWYWFEWGDGSNSGWVGPFNSGQTGSASHIWSDTGIYDVKVKAKDTLGAESTWSATTPVNISASTIELAMAGGLAKISATIKNIGASELANVDWSITVKGGLIGFINVESTGTINALAAGDEASVNTDKMIFGLGKIDITVTANEATLTAQGFVFGPFISIK